MCALGTAKLNPIALLAAYIRLEGNVSAVAQFFGCNRNVIMRWRDRNGLAELEGLFRRTRRQRATDSSRERGATGRLDDGDKTDE